MTCDNPLVFFGLLTVGIICVGSAAWYAAIVWACGWRPWKRYPTGGIKPLGPPPPIPPMRKRAGENPDPPPPEFRPDPPPGPLAAVYAPSVVVDEAVEAWLPLVPDWGFRDEHEYIDGGAGFECTTFSEARQLSRVFFGS